MRISGWRRFSDQEVADIRADRAAGVPLTKLAARYGVGKGNVSRIARGILYGHVSAAPVPAGPLAPRPRTGALSDQQVADIRAARGNGASLAELAREYGMNEKTLGHAATGHTYRHVDKPPVKRPSGPKRKLTRLDVEAVKNARKQGVSVAELAERYGVGITTIRRAIRLPD